MKTIVKVILSLLFIGCLFDMPYGYFQLVRFLGTIGFLILAFADRRSNEIINLWFYVWIASALLIQPFIKIPLGRTIWNIVDVAWVIIFLCTIILEFRKEKS